MLFNSRGDKIAIENIPLYSVVNTLFANAPINFIIIILMRNR